jgi:hypothetical protein
VPPPSSPWPRRAASPRLLTSLPRPFPSPPSGAFNASPPTRAASTSPRTETTPPELPPWPLMAGCPPTSPTASPRRLPFLLRPIKGPQVCLFPHHLPVPYSHVQQPEIGAPPPPERRRKPPTSISSPGASPFFPRPPVSSFCPPLDFGLSPVEFGAREADFAIRRRSPVSPPPGAAARRSVRGRPEPADVSRR